MKLILGNGKTAQSIARFLDKQGIKFTLIEDTRKTKGSAILHGIDEIFISPGITQTDAIVTQARAQKIPVISDIELFSRHAKAPIIGITGSNGKSTVTQLLGEMIANDGKKVAIGGNIGIPALDCLNDEIEYYVLELSSYQLDYTQNLTLLTGVVLNITPDHLDRYPSFEDYAQSKLSLYKYCQYLVVNIDEPLIPKQLHAKYFGIELPKKSTDFGTVTCHDSCYILKGDDSLTCIGDMQLIGEHNLKNALAALALGDQIGLNINTMITTLKTFKGLEHRLEFVVKKDNISYYNDSKATNSTSTITAIKALIPTNQNIVLIMGGIKKQEDYTPLFTLINQHITHTILISKDATTFVKQITHTTHAQTLQEAVKIAESIINNGIILLSPACASFDMFDNFEQRGQVFKDAVGKIS
ncbi:UDP-N-acetylmuramoylalanine--D-glutamate ligase [hydrothermal vent metagenome]|uniref:UDP-N-acetylmuramoylalanine--D-glutamate ligase n=1 Tax=hydrothermal vent metagenome TaxID=652676 RepID=A0A1W1E0W7_9ZZZZ